MINKNIIIYTLFSTSCYSKNIAENSECSAEEQGMFVTCINYGCSASYSQDMNGSDSCSIEGGGSAVYVEAGGECSFTSSGSCYVICDCPADIGFTYNVNDSNENMYEGDESGECQDEVDNDRDGLYDCDDPDCHGSPYCDNDSGSIVDTSSADDTSTDSDTGLEIDTGHHDDSDLDSGSSDDPPTDEDGDFFTVEDGDCNDRNPSINPYATDIVGDSIDQNCDGIDGTDIDGDGFASESSGGSDCDDFDSIINTDYGMLDIRDYIDSNCDGADGLSDSYKSLTIHGLVPAQRPGISSPLVDFDGDSISDLILYSHSSYYILFGSTIASTTSRNLSVSDMDVEIHLVGSGGFYDAFYAKDIDGDGKDDLAFNLSNGPSPVPDV